MKLVSVGGVGLKLGSAPLSVPKTAFTDYIRTISTNLEVLHAYDYAVGTATATATPDRRSGQTTRTGTLTGGYWGMDSALNGGSRAIRVGEFSGNLTVNNWTGDTGGTFTFAMVVRIDTFETTYTLVGGAGTGYIVKTTDEGTSAKISVEKNGTGVVAQSTVTISDIWKDHLVIVSMGGSTASTRILIDGVECTGSITTRTNGTASTRTLGTSTSGTNFVSISAFAEWSRQITPTEETALYNALDLDYQRRSVLHGIHCGTQFFSTTYHQRIVDAVDRYLSPDIVRLDLRWASMQTSNGGAIDYSFLDSAVNKYVAQGMAILITIAGSPTWANGGTDEFSIPTQGTNFTNWLNSYKTFVTAAVNRYKDRVSRWELWNEPNFGNSSSGFWRPLDGSYTTAKWGTDFANLCNGLRAAVIAADSTAQVCTGGMLSYHSAPGAGVSGKTLLFQAAASGLDADFPHFGIHPYVNSANSPRLVPDNDNAFADMRRMRDDLIVLSRSTATIWATEYGWYAVGNQDTGGALSTTAGRIQSSITDLRDYHSKYVDLFAYFCDFDRPNSGFYGLLTGVNGIDGVSGLTSELSPKATAPFFQAAALSQ